MVAQDLMILVISLFLIVCFSILGYLQTKRQGDVREFWKFHRDFTLPLIGFGFIFLVIIPWLVRGCS